MVEQRGDGDSAPSADDQPENLKDIVQFLRGRVEDLPTRQSNFVLAMSLMGVLGTLAGIMTSVYLNGAEAQMELRIQRAVEARFEAMIQENRKVLEEKIFLEGKALQEQIEQFKASSGARDN